MPTDPPELPDLRTYLRERHPSGGVARVEAGTDEANNLTVVIYAARPGVLIGKQGRTMSAVREELSAMLEPIRARLDLGPLRLNLVEIRQAELEPLLVADRVVQQISAGVDLEAALPRLVAGVIRAGGASAHIAVRRVSDGERLAGHGQQGERALTASSSEQVEISSRGELLRVEVEIGIAT